MFYFKEIKTINQFRKTIVYSKKIKKRIVKNILSNKKILKKDILALEKILKLFEKIETKKGKRVLKDDFGKKVFFGMDYEILELKKDIAYLKKGEDGLFEIMRKNIKNFDKQVSKLQKFVSSKKINVVVADRDGTINNYGERYWSSIQSVYNAVFLSRAFKKKKIIILSSAPLKEMKEVTIMPINSIILAGSKARELFFNNKIIKYPIKRKEINLILKIGKNIREFVTQKKYFVFLQIGSGFQQKRGEITIARQDVSGSINKSFSKEFFKKIKEIVSKNDFEKRISIMDTGLDIEIVLKSKENSFDKGDGILFSLSKTKISQTKEKILVCGDTKADVAMVKKIGKKAIPVFVGNKNKFGKELKKACFVSNPDVLITALLRGL
jgi:hydroxymethylpyrimidine pyrophosphatase-like HAD family hydrolase